MKNTFLQKAARVMLALVCAAFTLSAGGCNFSGISADSLMRPPKAAGDGAAIQSAMEEQLGTEITLRYPRKGDYRSAVVRADIDNDQNDEAIAFYRTAAENSGAHMIVLDTDSSGAWIIIGEAESNGGDIDTVMFGDVDGDGAREVITGWSLFSDASHIIAIHSCAEGKVKELEIDGPDNTNGQVAYTEMAVGDFDGNGRDDIIAVQLGSVSEGATACLYTLQVGSMKPVDSIGLDSTVITYIGVHAGMVNSQTFALVLDGYRADGRYSTELVVWDRAERRLCAPLNHEDTRECVFLRSESISSMDINGDEYIELPRDTVLPGYDDSSDDALYLTQWNMFDVRDELVDVTSGIMSVDYGYYFEIDPDWIGNVTARQDKALKTIALIDTADGTAIAEELLHIRVFTKDEWSAEEKWNPLDLLPDDSDKTPGYVLLAESDYYVYGVLVSLTEPEDPGEEPAPVMDYTSISENFHLL